MGGLFLFYAQYVACGKYQNKYDKNRLLHRQQRIPTIYCELRGGSTTSKNFFKKTLKKELTKGE